MLILIPHSALFIERACSMGRERSLFFCGEVGMKRRERCQSGESNDWRIVNQYRIQAVSAWALQILAFKDDLNQALMCKLQWQNKA